MFGWQQLAPSVTSIERFMFGNYELYEGLSFVPVMIGLFAISELLVQSKKAHLVAEVISLKAVKLPSREDYRRIWRTIVRGLRESAPSSAFCQQKWRLWLR